MRHTVDQLTSYPLKDTFTLNIFCCVVIHESQWQICRSFLTSDTCVYCELCSKLSLPFCLQIICKTECVLSTFAILPLPTVPYIFCRNGRRCNIWTRPSIKLCNIWILPAGRISREPLPSFWTPRGSEAESGQSWGVLKINKIVVKKI